MTRKIDTKNFTDEQRQEFVEGWESAGGYTDDFDTSAPWACPWFHGNTIIEVEGDTPDAWGRDWWRQCKDEIEELLKGEESEAN